MDQALESAALGAWAIVIRLLEDDDEAVRDEAAFLVSKTVTLESPSPSTLTSSLSAFASFSSSSSSSLVSPTTAFELTFAYLTDHFSSSALYVLFLFQLLLPIDGKGSRGTSHLAAGLLSPAAQLMVAFEPWTSFDPALFELDFEYLSEGQAWGNFGNILFEKEANNWYAALAISHGHPKRTQWHGQV